MASLTFKDWIEITSWGAGIVVAALAVWQFRQSIQQKRIEHRWRQSEAAMKLIEALVADPEYSVAAQILDDAPCRVPLKRSGEIMVTESLFEGALSAEAPDPVQADICVAFDAMFFHMALFNHYIGNKLVDLADIDFPIRYYIARLAVRRHVVEGYLKRWKLREALLFLGRFDEWTNAQNGHGTTAG
jgi:hypothetical protein